MTGTFDRFKLTCFIQLYDFISLNEHAILKTKFSLNGL